MFCYIAIEDGEKRQKVSLGKVCVQCKFSQINLSLMNKLIWNSFTHISFKCLRFWISDWSNKNHHDMDRNVRQPFTYCGATKDLSVWHQASTDWNSHTDLLWLYQSTLCQYLSLPARGLVSRAMIPFHTIEHGIRLTVSWLIWSSLSLSSMCVCGVCVPWEGWPTYWFNLLTSPALWYLITP